MVRHLTAGSSDSVGSLRLRPSGEPVLQEIEQAVESRIRDIHLRSVRSAIQSQASALVGGLGADLRSEPGQRRQVLLVLGRTGHRTRSREPGLTK